MSFLTRIPNGHHARPIEFSRRSFGDEPQPSLNELVFILSIYRKWAVSNLYTVQSRRESLKKINFMKFQAIRFVALASPATKSAGEESNLIPPVV